MAINPMYRQQPIRMMGMASGMDTDSIIQATLRMHQFKIDRQLRSRQIVEWKQQIHSDIKDQIKSLKDTYLSNLGSKNMMSRNTFNTNLATAMQGGQASTAVTVSTSSSSGLGKLTISQVVSMAKGASFSSAGKVSANGNGFALSDTLGSLNGGALNFSGYKTSVTGDNGATYLDRDTFNGINWNDIDSKASVAFGDKAISVTRTEDSGDFAFEYSVDGTTVALQDFGDGKFGIESEDGSTRIIFNENGKNLSYTIEQKEFDEEAQEDVWTEAPAQTNVNMAFSKEVTVGAVDASGAATTDSITLKQADNGTITNGSKVINAGSFVGNAELTINTEGGKSATINLTSNMTLSQMISQVNNSSAGVTMSYDRLADSFKFESKTIGDSSSISISDTAGLVDIMKGQGNTTNWANAAEADAGKLTEIKFSDGTTATSTNNTVNFRGITIRVNHTTEEDDEPIQIEVKRDTDKAVNAIKDFLESYNSIIAKLEGLLNDRKSSKEKSYEPLTDEEKSAMTEKQIEEWEAIAKKGILRNDRGIQDLVTSLRGSFFKQIENTGLSASQLGLTTGSYFGGTGGQILLDEEGEKKLRAALEADPDRVADVFIRIETNPDGSSKGVGLLHKINDIFNGYIGTGKTQSVSVEALEKSYQEINDRIAKLEERMWAEEDKLYRQFAAMESAMSGMQQQGDWFNAMLGK